MQVYADEMQNRVRALEKQLVEATNMQKGYISQAETSLQNLGEESAQKLVDQAARLARVRTPT